jgi:hypothetical protein
VDEEARDQGKRWQEVKTVARNKVRWRSEGPVLHVGVKGLGYYLLLLLLLLLLLWWHVSSLWCLKALRNTASLPVGVLYGFH